MQSDCQKDQTLAESDLAKKYRPTPDTLNRLALLACRCCLVQCGWADTVLDIRKELICININTGCHPELSEVFTVERSERIELVLLKLPPRNFLPLLPPHTERETFIFTKITKLSNFFSSFVSLVPYEQTAKDQLSSCKLYNY